MDGFWYHMMYEYPYGGMLIGMFIIWIIQVLAAYLVYRDAVERKINAVLWFVLVVLPMIGWLFLMLYVIIRETPHPSEGKSALQILMNAMQRARSLPKNTSE
jgi:putative membrane protein